MIVIDIGNTNIVIGVFLNKKIHKIIRFDTKDKDLIKKIRNHYYIKKILKSKKIKKTCILSSVSNISEDLIINFFKSFKFKLLNINTRNITNKVKFNYISGQLGADRIANTVAAISKYGNNSIVVDFGTATTFDIILNNQYEGGLIAPGIKISLNSLVDQASKLNKISIKKTKKIIGNNTKNSMQSGFYWGYVSLINGIIEKILLEKKLNLKIILTGGLAKIFIKDIKFKTYHEPNLTLHGLYLIGQKKYG